MFKNCLLLLFHIYILTQKKKQRKGRQKNWRSDLYSLPAYCCATPHAVLLSSVLSQGCCFPNHQLNLRSLRQGTRSLIILWSCNRNIRRRSQALLDTSIVLIVAFVTLYIRTCLLLGGGWPCLLEMCYKPNHMMILYEHSTCFFLRKRYYLH